MFQFSQEKHSMTEVEISLLSIRGLSAVIAGRPILDAIHLDVHKGELLSILGPSGCGKTTLLRMIAGFAAPEQGTILLDGQRIDHLPAASRPINTVFQNYSLFPHLTVGQNVAFGLEMLRRPRVEITARVAEMLQLVQLADYADRSAASLSGGQQQRVALARALAPSPRLLLLDEPLSALDRHLRLRMQTELKRLQRNTSTTFIFVTHDQDEAFALSDRVAVMNAGRIEQVDVPEALYARPVSRFVAAFIGDSNLVEGRIAGGHLLVGNEQIFLPDQADGPVTLVVKPQDVVLDHTGLSATVADVRFAGEAFVVAAALSNGAIITLRLREAPAPGQTIRLSFAAARYHLLRATA